MTAPAHLTCSNSIGTPSKVYRALIMRDQAYPLKRDLLVGRRPFFVNVDTYAFAFTVGVLVGYLIWG